MSPEDVLSEHEIEPTTTLSAQHLRAYVARVDDDVDVLVLYDGEVRVDISTEMGSPMSAAMAMERLASAAMARADMLRREAKALARARRH